MKRLILVAGLLAVSACVPVTSYAPPAPPEPVNNGYPVHPDPYCVYGEPEFPGGPYSEACA